MLSYFKRDNKCLFKVCWFFDDVHGREKNFSINLVDEKPKSNVIAPKMAESYKIKCNLQQLKGTT